ncbi:salivary endonuclease-like [Anticarsia gemmatalis]|uniref:salivary endonuclease-like n=1 Tax=Anticarsia gemmatalis TaxID=129554 RepID=UPI003F76606E
MADVMPVFLLFISFFICDVKSDCVLSLNKDFGKPAPVLIKNGIYLDPDINGVVRFKKSETVLVACPGTKGAVVVNNVTTSHQDLEVKCMNATKFKVEKQTALFKEIRCNTQPFFTAEKTKETCTGNSIIYDVGYRIRSKLYPLYRACFDQYMLHTHYVSHQLSPTSKFGQTDARRPKFIEGNLFGKVRMTDVYRIQNQKKQLDSILGANMHEKFITKSQSLSKGHLAARADFSLNAEMRGTFHYVNTGPQWQRGNAGDWAALEEALRRRVHERRASVHVMTGTHGVMTLPDSKGHMKEFYLYTDENNNHAVPVPMYFYKLVYDPVAKTAAAFITINSSFYNQTMTNELQFCDDICEENSSYNWLRWRSNDGTHSFCCNYDQFIEEIDYLPQLDVVGPFY